MQHDVGEKNDETITFSRVIDFTKPNWRPKISRDEVSRCILLQRRGQTECKGCNLALAKDAVKIATCVENEKGFMGKDKLILEIWASKTWKCWGTSDTVTNGNAG